MKTSTKKTLVGLSVLLPVLAAAAWLATAPARAQPAINAAPNWLPIGVAASGNTSTAWFHEPGSRQVLACRRDGGGGPDRIDCVSGRMP